ncbi:MAG: putative toxin-antitoxin system toxin component, PIN family [Candidatus Nanoarchaeia archaeon]
MMRITVDTNVLISATLTYGACEKIIDLAEQKNIILCLSEPILKEYYEHLYPKKNPPKQQVLLQALTVNYINYFKLTALWI